MNSSVKPDFSGEWVLERQASHLTGGASAMETGVLRIDHRDPKCGFQISMSARGESVERAWESSLSDEIPVVDSRFYRRLFWEGDALVFECGSNGADETWSMLWRHQLLDAGFEPLSRCAVLAVILTTLGSSKCVECAMGRAKSLTFTHSERVTRHSDIGHLPRTKRPDKGRQRAWV